MAYFEILFVYRVRLKRTGAYQESLYNPTLLFILSFRVSTWADTGSRCDRSAAIGKTENLSWMAADSGDRGQVFRLIADSDSDPSRTAFR
jgi:hypothetical protein